MPAAYSEDLRERVLKFLEKKNDKKLASDLFNVGIATVYRWADQFKKKGHLKPRKRLYAFKIIDEDQLKKYIEENPDAFLFEIGDHFSVTPQSVFYACRRLKITRKKKRRYT